MSPSSRSSTRGRKAPCCSASSARDGASSSPPSAERTDISHRNLTDPRGLGQDPRMLVRGSGPLRTALFVLVLTGFASGKPDSDEGAPKAKPSAEAKPPAEKPKAEARPQP